MGSFRKDVFAVAVALCCASFPGAVAQEKTPYDYVDPLIGTINGGHVFPGATLPFGMAKAGADVDGENQGGFASDNSSIWGFSHMHDSGTGGSASLGNFPIFAHAGCPNDDVNGCAFNTYDRLTPRVNGTVVARPGYFAITLENQVRAEMTVTNKTALYRFTFPETPVTPNTTLNPLILLELSDLPRTRTDANISVLHENGTSGRMTGQGVFEPSFGVGRYRSFFCADFDGAELKDAGVWLHSRAGYEKTVSVFSELNRASRRPAGGWMQFQKPDKNNQILVRVGMSFKSEEQACHNGETEIPNNDFDAVVKAAENAWKEKLSVITIEPGGVDEGSLRAFWSGVYRTMISPQDYTGENPYWDSGEPYYDSYYCIWDSYRTIHPLLTLLDPHSQTLMVRSLLDIYKHEGKLPDCRMSFCKGFTQGGSNADALLADSYFKNITEGVDWNLAYEAVVSDAEEEPLNWDIEGRGGLESWKALNYIPTENYDILGVGTETRSISRTTEFSYDDFTIATLARELGHSADYQKYLKRSGNWKNMFKADQTSFINGNDTGFTGFLQPKFMNGTWGFQDPIRCSPLMELHGCYFNQGGGETYESPIWLYTFDVPQDQAHLIETLGGREEYVRRLDFLHEYPGLLNIENEPAFLKVYMYHYAGRPAKSALRAHTYIPSAFNDSINGIPGNDDSGAMGSFQALTMMGVFPNAGQDVYFITPPFFESVSIRNGQTGKTATIRNINFDPSGKNVYIQSATMNGKPYTKNWYQHNFFLEGGTLELTLGSEESDWGTRLEDVPPSLGPYSNGTTPGVNTTAKVKDKRWHMPKLDISFPSLGGRL